MKCVFLKEVFISPAFGQVCRDNHLCAGLKAGGGVLRLYFISVGDVKNVEKPVFEILFLSLTRDDK